MTLIHVGRMSTAELYGQLFDRTPLARRGYEPDQVDRFVQRVRDEYTALHEEKHTLTRENDALRNRLALLQSTDPKIQAEAASAQAIGILSQAQRQADQWVSEASDECRKIVSDARGQYDDLLREAHQRAQDLVAGAEATLHAYRDRDGSQPSEEITQCFVDLLRSLGQAARTQLRTLEEAAVRNLAEELRHVHTNTNTSAHPTSAHPTSAHPASAHPTSAHPTSAHPTDAHPTSAHPTGAHPADAAMVQGRAAVSSLSAAGPHTGSCPPR